MNVFYYNMFDFDIIRIVTVIAGKTYVSIVFYMRLCLFGFFCFQTANFNY